MRACWCAGWSVCHPELLVLNFQRAVSQGGLKMQVPGLPAQSEEALQAIATWNPARESGDISSVNTVSRLAAGRVMGQAGTWNSYNFN